VSFHRKKLADGSYLVSRKEDRDFRYHWHVAPDGTILSVKDGGNYIYNRGHIRQHIREVTGLDWDDRYDWN